jgi:hypothetical protein
MNESQKWSIYLLSLLDGSVPIGAKVLFQQQTFSGSATLRLVILSATEGPAVRPGSLTTLHAAQVRRSASPINLSWISPAAQTKALCEASP